MRVPFKRKSKSKAAPKSPAGDELVAKVIAQEARLDQIIIEHQDQIDQTREAAKTTLHQEVSRDAAYIDQRRRAVEKEAQEVEVKNEQRLALLASIS